MHAGTWAGRAGEPTEPDLEADTQDRPPALGAASARLRAWNGARLGTEPVPSPGEVTVTPLSSGSAPHRAAVCPCGTQPQEDAGSTPDPLRPGLDSECLSSWRPLEWGLLVLSVRHDWPGPCLKCLLSLEPGLTFRPPSCPLALRPHSHREQIQSWNLEIEAQGLLVKSTLG